MFGIQVMVDKEEKPKETNEERRFREYIRALNTPAILPPDVYIDKYSPNISGKEVE
jgi:hypothetical protein